MRPKKQRLTAVEVRSVLRRGHSSRAGHLSLKHLPAATPLRISVVVAKSVAKKATERNRLRRSVYRTLQTHAGQGLAVVFVQKIPPPPQQAAFSADLAVLLKNI